MSNFLRQVPEPPTHLFFFCETPPGEGGEVIYWKSSFIVIELAYFYLYSTYFVSYCTWAPIYCAWIIYSTLHIMKQLLLTNFIFPHYQTPILQSAEVCRRMELIHPVFMNKLEKHGVRYCCLLHIVRSWCFSILFAFFSLLLHFKISLKLIHV